MRDFRPDRVWSDLPFTVQEWVKETLRREGFAPGDWPEVAALRTALVFAGASERIRRYMGRGASRSEAMKRTASDYGLSSSAIRKMFARAERQVENAVRAA